MAGSSNISFANSLPWSVIHLSTQGNPVEYRLLVLYHHL